MRPSEPMKLRWADVDFKLNNLTKHKTKSGKTLLLRMNKVVRCILEVQRDLLDRSSKPMRESEYVFPTESGGMRGRDSYQVHFRRIRELAGIPKAYRPNYCLRDTIASMMLSNGATLDEVAFQLGHEPGSPMTKRYARFIPDAQKRIAEQSASAMEHLLKATN